MNAKTLRALRASIRHWERVSTDPKNEEDLFSKGCPLCKLFMRQHERRDDNCKGCPVRRRTGKSLCIGSPWLNAMREAYNFRAGRTYNKGAMMTEVEFLRSLLPKKERK